MRRRVSAGSSDGRPLTPTRAPSLASLTAVAWPIPVQAPVTNATLPANRFSILPLRIISRLVAPPGCGARAAVGTRCRAAGRTCLRRACAGSRESELPGGRFSRRPPPAAWPRTPTSSAPASSPGCSTRMPSQPRPIATAAKLVPPASFSRSTDCLRPSKKNLCHIASQPSVPLFSTMLTVRRPCCAWVASSPIA